LNINPWIISSRPIASILDKRNGLANISIEVCMLIPNANNYEYNKFTNQKWVYNFLPQPSMINSSIVYPPFICMKYLYDKKNRHCRNSPKEKSCIFHNLDRHAMVNNNKNDANAF
jgi:hypothetical protein